MSTNSVFLKKILDSCIHDLAASFRCFVRNPDTDFSRSRKISFEEVIRFCLSLQAGSLEAELLSFSGYSPSVPSSSAMIQARQKVLPECFVSLLRQFNSRLGLDGRFCGMRVLAVDGSYFLYPENRKEPLCWTRNPHTESGKNSVLLNAVYDLRLGIFEEFCFQEHHNANENKGFAELLSRRPDWNRCLFVADRGYESFNTFAAVREKNADFLIRGKGGKTGIQAGLKLPGREEFDETVSIVLCGKHTGNTKKYPEKYKRIRTESAFDFFREDCREYRMTFRVVKLKVNENLTEILFTSLPRETFPPSRLRELYHMRWGIETAFHQLKYALGALALHSVKYDFVIQEIGAKIVLFNLGQAVVAGTEFPPKSRNGKARKINVTRAMEIIRAFWHGITQRPEGIEKLLRKYLVPVRKGRQCCRKNTQKKAVPFNHRLP